jgi:hypothetical protein
MHCFMVICSTFKDVSTTTCICNSSLCSIWVRLSTFIRVFFIWSYTSIWVCWVNLPCGQTQSYGCTISHGREFKYLSYTSASSQSTRELLDVILFAMSLLTCFENHNFVSICIVRPTTTPVCMRNRDCLPTPRKEAQPLTVNHFHLSCIRRILKT